MIRRLSASAAWIRPALVDEEGGLLLGAADDALGLLLGLLDDPLALGVDALGGADLLGDGDPQLVDEAERGVLVDHDVRRQRQLLAVRDQRLEALDEEDDVDRSALQRSAVPGADRARAGPGDYGTGRGEAAAQRGQSAAVEGALEGRRGRGRDHPRDVAAERRDLLDQARADVAVRRPRS